MTLHKTLTSDKIEAKIEKDLTEDSENENGIKPMSRKTCAVCGGVVYQGEGTIYAGRLIHRTCKGIAKIWYYRLRSRRLSD